MKKILALLLSLMLVLSLAACGGDDTTDAAVDEEPVVTDEAETPDRRLQQRGRPLQRNRHRRQ